MNVNLFGDELGQQVDPYEEELVAYDENTFDERLTRLKYLHRVFPTDYSFMMSLSAHHLFNESRRAFVNGEFVGTMLLAQAFIEHWLQPQLEARGYCFSKSKGGLYYIINCLRDGKHMHNFLIDKIDCLRRVRNPFVHAVPFEDPYNISQMSLSTLKAPEVLLEEQAQEALSIMCTVAVTRLV